MNQSTLLKCWQSYFVMTPCAEQWQPVTLTEHLVSVPSKGL